MVKTFVFLLYGHALSIYLPIYVCLHTSLCLLFIDLLINFFIYLIFYYLFIFLFIYCIYTLVSLFTYLFIGISATNGKLLYVEQLQFAFKPSPSPSSLFSNTI
jgi:hypothetical protein